MKKVSAQEFYDFLKDKEYTIVGGRFTHEDTFIEDKTMNILAIRESSSYSSETIYKIKAIT